MNNYIDRYNFSITLLEGEEKEYLLKQTNLYLKKLNINNTKDLNKLQFIKVWNGCGTVNIHNVPIIPNCDMISFINTIYEIYNIIEDDKFTLQRSMKTEYETVKDKLCLKKDDKFKIFSIIAYLLIFEPSKEKAIYTLGQYINTFLEGVND